MRADRYRGKTEYKTRERAGAGADAGRRRKPKAPLQRVRNITALILFVAIFLGLISIVSETLERKSVTPPWDMTVKTQTFYKQPENSINLMFFGSSHMYCSIDPNMLDAITGENSYVFATQKQPIWLSYHYMKEALKTQKLKTMVLEVNMLTQKEDYSDEATNYTAMDNIPFSLNKMQMAFAAAPWGDRKDYIFNIYKYHSRWEELTPEDFEKTYKDKNDENKGYVMLEGTVPNQGQAEDFYNVTESLKPSDKNIEYLQKIVKLAEENGIQLILAKFPSNPTVAEQKNYNWAWQFAEEKGIEYIDYNMRYEELGLDTESDFYDLHHVNRLGVEKVVAHFGEYLNGI